MKDGKKEKEEIDRRKGRNIKVLTTRQQKTKM